MKRIEKLVLHNLLFLTKTHICSYVTTFYFDFTTTQSTGINKPFKRQENRQVFVFKNEQSERISLPLPPRIFDVILFQQGPNSSFISMLHFTIVYFFGFLFSFNIHFVRSVGENSHIQSMHSAVKIFGIYESSVSFFFIQ
jgi:hypothetical protein